MSPVSEKTPDMFGRVSEIEQAFLSHVNAAVGDLQRIECLEEEQRAEIHAILEALKHDGESHAGSLQQLMGEYRDA